MTLTYVTGVELVDRLAERCDDPIERIDIENLKAKFDRIDELEMLLEDEQGNAKILEEDLSQLPDRSDLDDAVDYLQDALEDLEGIGKKTKKVDILDLLEDVKKLIKKALDFEKMVPE